MNLIKASGIFGISFTDFMRVANYDRPTENTPAKYTATDTLFKIYEKNKKENY
jgi:hypothetical protein